jgi:hypothetical protein
MRRPRDEPGRINLADTIPHLRRALPQRLPNRAPCVGVTAEHLFKPIREPHRKPGIAEPAAAGDHVGDFFRRCLSVDDAAHRGPDVIAGLLRTIAPCVAGIRSAGLLQRRQRLRIAGKQPV